MFCKTIILSNSNNLNSNSPKGILTLSKESGYIKGKIRLYNLNNLPTNTKIGLYVDEKVHTSMIIKKTNYYEFNVYEDIDISQSIYCALIDASNNQKNVLLEGGSFSGFCFTDSPIDAVLEAKDESLEREIDNALAGDSECENCDCSNCEYKKYFYEHYSSSNQDTPKLSNDNNESKISTAEQSNNSALDESKYIENLQLNVIETLENEIINDTLSLKNTKSSNQTANKQNDESFDTEKLDFLNDIVYQLDEMFNKYPLDETLNNIIPNSKFICVDGENPYILGTIYEDDQLQYIAYGVPAKYNTLPPKDLGNNYQWLPINPRDVMSDGYFIIFQNALTGSLVEIDFQQE